MENVREGEGKIKRSVFIKQYADGGLKMIDIKSYICSMKIKLKELLIHEESNCYKLVNNIFDVNKVFNMGKIYCKYVSKNIRNEFWIDVLKAYVTFMENVRCNDWFKVLHMPLFYNEHFLIYSKHIFIEDFYNRGVRLVKDVMDVNGNFLTHEHIENIVGKRVNWLVLHSLRNSINSFISKNNTAEY